MPAKEKKRKWNITWTPLFGIYPGYWQWQVPVGGKSEEDWGWLEEHGFGLSLWDEQPAFGDDCKE